MGLQHREHAVESYEGAKALAQRLLADEAGPKAKLLWYDKLANDMVELHRPALGVHEAICDSHLSMAVETAHWEAGKSFLATLLEAHKPASGGIAWHTVIGAVRMRITWGFRAGRPYLGFMAPQSAPIKDVTSALSLLAQAVGGLFTVSGSPTGHELKAADSRCALSVLQTADDGISPIAFDLLSHDADLKVLIPGLPPQDGAQFHVFAMLSRCDLDAASLALAAKITPSRFWTKSFLGGLKGKRLPSDLTGHPALPIGEWRDRKRDHFIQYELTGGISALRLIVYSGSTASND